MNAPERPPADDKTALFHPTRAIPLALLLCAAVLFFAMGWHHYFTLASLKTNRGLLLSYVHAHPFYSAAIFFGIYSGALACSIPINTPLNLAGGFLFGWLEGGLLGITAATVGATIIFMATETALAGPLRAIGGKRLIRVEDAIRKNALFYLLISRIVPIFPFFLVNIAAGLLDVPFSTFVLTTFFGEMPVTFTYASLGGGLGRLFDHGAKPDLDLLAQPSIFLPLAALALLILIPAGWRAYTMRRKQG